MTGDIHNMKELTLHTSNHINILRGLTVIPETHNIGLGNKVIPELCGNPMHTRRITNMEILKKSNFMTC